MTAYSYIRFSTKEQINGDSLNRQLTAAREWCTKHQIELSDKGFRDLGISGYSGKERPDLSAMLIAIENGSIKEGDYIILENLDRLSRQGIDKTQEIIRQILRKGVNIESLQDGISLNKDSLNDLLSVIRIAISADLAHKESVKKSERVQAAKNRQKEDALKGLVIKKRLPYWLQNDGDKYVFNENVGAIQTMIEMRKQGYGYKSISMALNKSEFAPRGGKQWSGTTIADILRHPALYGTYEFGTTDDNGKFIAQNSVDNYYPALCTYSEYKSFQSNFTKSAGGITKHNHLYRLVRCQCGSAMSKKVGKRSVGGTIKHYNQWICVSSLSGGCDQKSAMLDLDKLVFKATNHLSIDEIKVGDSDNLILQIATKETRVNELSAILGMADFSGAVVEIASAISKIKSEISDLKSQLVMDVATKEDIQKLVTLVDNPEQFNMQLRRLVKHIIVYPKAKNIWKVKIVQHNGHLINVTTSRKSQRNPWIYFFGKTEQILALAKDSEFDDFDD